MGTPNEYMPSALYGYPQNEVTPYTHQAPQPAANFSQFASNAATGYFNNGGFFPNPLNHDSLPAFHANTNTARTPCFNASTFVQGEPQPLYNANATQDMAYWSQQPQLSPFGVLPHEIADQSTMYNNAQSVHFVASHSALNAGNVTTPNNIFPGVHAPLIKYTNERATNSRQFIMNDGTQSSQINNNRLPASSPLVQPPSVPEFRDRSRSTPFQSTSEFHSTPLVQKNIGEYRESSRSSPLVRQNMSEYNNDSSRSSPLLPQNMSEYRDDSRSSPLVQPKISEYRDNSRSSPQIIVSGHRESPFLNRNHANTAVPHANLPLVYGDTQQRNVVCQNVDENRVTSPYLQLPHTAPAVVNSSSANATEVGRVNQSLYAAYNSATNTCGTVDLQRKEPTVETSSSVSTLGSAYHVEQRSNFPIQMTDVGDSSNRPNVMSTKATIAANSLVEYPPCTSALDEQQQRDSYLRQSSCTAETFEARTKSVIETNICEGTSQKHQMFEQDVHRYQYNTQPTTSSSLPVVEPSPQTRKMSSSDTTVHNRSNKIARYDVPPTPPSSCSSVDVDSQQQTYLRNNTSSAESSPYVTPSPSETLHANSSPNAFRTFQETMPPSSVIMPQSPSQGSTSEAVRANVTVAAGPSSPDCIVAREEMVGNVRVIVPDIEAEFEFLFDPNLPHYDEIVGGDDERRIRADCQPTYCRKSVDFLGSYIKFLEDNGENVERLKASHANATKRWFVDDGGTSHQSPTLAGDGGTSARKESEEDRRDFDDDPRYYPLPKTSDQRRLTDTSSDDDDDDEMARKIRVKSEPGLTIQEASQSSAAERSVKLTLKSSTEEDRVGCGNSVKQEFQSKEVDKVRKKKHKRDAEKKSKSKSKWRKMSSEFENSEQSGRETPEHSAKETEERIGRKVSLRKAKIEVQERIKKAVETDDEDSADSDPSWSPRDDDEDESFPARKSSRTVRSGRKLSEPNSSARKDTKNGIAKSKYRERSDSETDDDLDSFFVHKNQIDSKKHPLWRLRGEKLQKFEPKKRDGKRVFSSVSQYVSVSNSGLNKYEKVEVHVLNRSKGCLTVELRDEMDMLTDEKVRDNFMSKSSRYKSQFAVYVQTLVSQALDSNFLDEIVRENDTYFLDNVKAIEDETATYLDEFSSLVKCAGKTVDLLMKTWPFVSIETRNNDSYRDGEGVCACCDGTNATKTAIFYGQPYKRETLQGSTTNIPNNIDKTADLCKGCAKKIQLFSKIWHQKYHLFVECAKCVSKKRTLNKNKVTTDILNELLADDLWLSKLFYDFRNTWLMVWTMVQKTRKKLCSDGDDARS